ncbi:MAG: methionine--tRNA ligase [Treponema sp.]|nr:methionine--tRNA ligase [Spirochaetales bacterium]MDY5812318.1 methionine--tRNA ligase [Treponema sp.]
MENIKIKNTRRLITSALPYVNNIPHLGNLIQMLSADVYARFCRSRGYETMYIFGTDEYGTATETRALQENKTPRELCDYYYEEHRKIYEWFKIDADKFGRTSNEQCTEITQSLYKDLDKNGYIKEHSNKQLYCPKCARFLADRYVNGTCPKCGFEDARGDQCDGCGSLLEPVELKNPRCSVCGATPEVRETKHLYIDLPSISKNLDDYVSKTSVAGKWSDNAIRMTKAWIRDGLIERAITRDLKWGIPVPRAGFEDKVFYVWFNAPIGYISITKQLADDLIKASKPSFDWKSWWLPEESQAEDAKKPVELFQFIGKDNIPFHTVIFPCTLMGSGRNWTKLFHMSSTEYLNYENGKFSKSRGVGVFGTDAIETGIPADAWRFYIFYNRPEKQDYQFTWKEFRERLNGELIGNLGNLVNRTLLFIQKYYNSKIPEAPIDQEIWAKVKDLEEKITENLEWANLKDALHQIFEISDIGNKAFQATEPWKTRETDPARAAKLIHTLAYMIKDLMIMVHPYMPQFAEKIMSYFGKTISETHFNDENFGKPSDGIKLNWNNLGETTGLSEVGATEVFFTPLDAKGMEAFRAKFSGKQSERGSEKKADKKKEKKAKPEPVVLPKEQMPAHFNSKIELRVAKILKVENNPESDKLYVETLDDGTGAERIIQSGLRDYVKAEDLLGKNIILAYNLAPRKMRGIESHGMLLAADYKDESGKDCVEVLEAPWAKPGTKVVLEGADINAVKPAEITADAFFAVEIKAENNNVTIGGVNLTVDGKILKTVKTVNGDIH